MACTICKGAGHNKSGHQSQIHRAKFLNEKPLRDVFEKIFGGWYGSFTINPEIRTAEIKFYSSSVNLDQLIEVSEVLNTKKIVMNSLGGGHCSDCGNESDYPGCYGTDAWSFIRVEEIDPKWFAPQ